MSKSVLVVDDSKLARDLVAYMVGAGGYAVEVASDGADALERLSASTFDLALVDLNMPIMNGYELIRRIRADASFGSMAIVIVSTEAEAADKTRGVEAGADLFLVKPVKESELLASIRVIIGGPDD
jgi:two-component system, chemotaxis family, chemotaxis protein CheY